MYGEAYIRIIRMSTTNCKSKFTAACKYAASYKTSIRFSNAMLTADQYFNCCENFQYPVSNVKTGRDAYICIYKCIYIYIHDKTFYGTKTKSTVISCTRLSSISIRKKVLLTAQR